jgi:hypothetical protein
LIEEVGWYEARENGHPIIPKSVTVQDFDFEEFKIMHNSKEIDCNQWITYHKSKQEGEDTLGWFRNHDGYWIDTVRGEEYKYNFHPPTHEEKNYYSNFTTYTRFDLGANILHPKQKLKVM